MGENSKTILQYFETFEKVQEQFTQTIQDLTRNYIDLQNQTNNTPIYIFHHI
jgi:hypothetical protein